ncbi:MAG: DUF3617 family protein [Deltaproteobacteria bacterium]|nr:DUF3617 family protein [Deltaproteobacteria bacterium]
MRKIAFALFLVLPLGAVAEDYPSRKPGLWEIETSMPGMPGGGNKMKHCIDAATDAAMMNAGKSMSEGMGCTKNEFGKRGANFVAESDCNANGTRMISKTVFSGDFSSNYSGEIVTKFEPPMAGMSEQKMTLSARWLGECEADQKPGDVIMPNGMKLNMNSMGAMGQR